MQTSNEATPHQLPTAQHFVKFPSCLCTLAEQCDCPSPAPVRSHHLVLRLGVDAHHARVAIGDSLVIRVFIEKGLHILNIRCS